MKKVTIAIPVYNAATTIYESLMSAYSQDYENKEILIVDQQSNDGTGAICKSFQQHHKFCTIRYIVDDKKGIGTNLVECMNRAKGEYVVYLCADDLFVDSHVVSDYAAIFDTMKEIGVIGHYFYQFMDGWPGAVMVSRDKNIITSSCNPSGMAFRKDNYEPCDKIFIEMPMLVAQAIKKYMWTMVEYDTIAVRIHRNNTALKGWYYTESPVKNWHEVTGKFDYYPMFVQIKNRCPSILWREICQCVKLNPRSLLSLNFMLNVLVAVIVPGRILRPLSRFIRHRISRIFVKIIRRPSE